MHLRELADQPMIGWTGGTFSYRWLVHTMRAAGVEPLIPHTAEEHSTQLALVAAGLGLAILPRIGRTAPSEGIAVVRLPPPGPAHLRRLACGFRRASGGPCRARRRPQPLTGGGAPVSGCRCRPSRPRHGRPRASRRER
ncbi:MAG: hypothetical protein J2P24_03555 [Streptosporangiales bacterium]|nr:hypothetical protein [Streptosporangiales bacterium]MBO0889419.1 hypothetical protein [Acidothermales bacterium]